MDSLLVSHDTAELHASVAQVGRLDQRMGVIG